MRVRRYRDYKSAKTPASSQIADGLYLVVVQSDSPSEPLGLSWCLALSGLLVLPDVRLKTCVPALSTAYSLLPSDSRRNHLRKVRSFYTNCTNWRFYNAMTPWQLISFVIGTPVRLIESHAINRLSQNFYKYFSRADFWRFLFANHFINDKSWLVH